MDDRGGITGIYNHYIRSSNVTFDTRQFTPEARADWFEQFAGSGPYRLYVAASDNAILGWASSTRLRPKPAYDRSVETTIYLHPEETGRGLGTRLYDRLLAADHCQLTYRFFKFIGFGRSLAHAYIQSNLLDIGSRHGIVDAEFLLQGGNYLFPMQSP